MSEKEYEALFAESLLKLDAYIATQATEKQIFQAQSRRRHIEQNKAHWKYRIDKGERFHLCRQCGALDSGGYREPIATRMRESGLCFHCDYWEQEVVKSDPNRLIIDGHIYGDGGNRPNEPKKHLLGFGGSVWTIERDGNIWQTNNLWSGSTIPQEYRERMPDNAHFVKGASK